MIGRNVFLEAGWLVGFEPTTFRTTIWRSNLLNYSHRVRPLFWNRLQRYSFYLDIPNVEYAFLSLSVIFWRVEQILMAFRLHVARNTSKHMASPWSQSIGRACLAEQEISRRLCVWGFSLERRAHQTRMIPKRCLALPSTRWRSWLVAGLGRSSRQSLLRREINWPPPLKGLGGFALGIP